MGGGGGGEDGQRHVLAALTPVKGPGTHCRGGWFPGLVYTGMENRRTSRRPSRFEPRTAQTAATRYTDYAIPAPPPINVYPQ
jgi:hypothetical protein